MIFSNKRIQSFSYAFKGINTLFSTQPNARIHLVIAITTVLLGYFFSISNIEWLLILIVIFIVIVTEAVNTSLEFLGDAVTMDKNENIKKSKDLGAAAVLLASVLAIIVGIMIFLPKILTL
jgi:diacylglycerol kinase